MLLPLLALYGASAADIDGYRRDVYYVIDAYVAKRVERVDGHRQVEYAVFWDERPRLRGRARIVSSEWVVVDGTGRLMSASQFHALSGHISGPVWRRGARTWLAGVQATYDRRDVEAWAEERLAAAGTRRDITPSHADGLRDGLFGQLPEPSWSVVRPDSLD